MIVSVLLENVVHETLCVWFETCALRWFASLNIFSFFSFAWIMSLCNSLSKYNKNGADLGDELSPNVRALFLHGIGCVVFVEVFVKCSHLCELGKVRVNARAMPWIVLHPFKISVLLFWCFFVCMAVNYVWVKLFKLACWRVWRMCVRWLRKSYKESEMYHIFVC